MPIDRRAVLQAGAATATVSATASALAAAAATGSSGAGEPPPGDEPVLDPVPPLPAKRTPGRPGDFDFLAGEWRIEHWRRPSPTATTWERFSGEATCWTILGGVGSVEELRVPSRNFSGMGLRLLDVKERLWSDFWVNAKSGVLTSPGQNGSFEDGVGLFSSEDEEGGRKMLYAGVWDRITARSCRWRQVASADGGRTWSHDWVMLWRRA